MWQTFLPNHPKSTAGQDYSDLQFKHRDLLVETEKHLERANTYASLS